MADQKRTAASGQRTAKKPAPKKPAAKRPAANKVATSRPAQPGRETHVTQPPAAGTLPREARAMQRTARQSPYKMRLVIDQIRGRTVNEALSLLAFSKKHAAKQIEKVVRSAVANAENAARSQNATLDVDDLVIKYAVINEGPKLKRWTPAAMGRATPVLKRTSHVEIVVSERPEGR